MSLYRLESLSQSERPLRVEPCFPGRIAGVTLATSGLAGGHEFELDRTTIEQLAEHGVGVRGGWIDGALGQEALVEHLGRWVDVRAEPFRRCDPCVLEVTGFKCAVCGGAPKVAWRVVGDFAFAESSHQLHLARTDVPVPVFLMRQAHENPRGMRVSILARFRVAEMLNGTGPRRLARVGAARDVMRADWLVDPPVCTPAGPPPPVDLWNLLNQPVHEVLEAMEHKLTAQAEEIERLRALLVEDETPLQTPLPDDDPPAGEVAGGAA